MFKLWSTGTGRFCFLSAVRRTGQNKHSTNRSGYGSLFSIVLGIVGLILAGNAKKGGNTEGIRTAGFIVSLIALIGGCLVFLYLVLAIALVGAAWQGIFNLLK